jgi:hypothetical protein
MNRTIVVDKHEGVWDRWYVEDLESELERQKAIVTIMSKRLAESEGDLRMLKQTLFALCKDVIE